MTAETPLKAHIDTIQPLLLKTHTGKVAEQAMPPQPEDSELTRLLKAERENPPVFDRPEFVLAVPKLLPLSASLKPLAAPMFEVELKAPSLAKFEFKIPELERVEIRIPEFVFPASLHYQHAPVPAYTPSPMQRLAEALAVANQEMKDRQNK